MEDWTKDEELKKVQDELVEENEQAIIEMIKPIRKSDIEQAKIEEAEGWDKRLKYWPAPIKKAQFLLNAADTNAGKTTYAISTVALAYREKKKILVILTEDSEKTFLASIEAILGDDIHEYFFLLELPRYDDENFAAIMSYANNNYDYVMIDYVEHSSYSSAKQGSKDKYMDLGHLYNVVIGQCDKVYVIVNTQTNGEMSKAIGSILNKEGEAKGPKNPEVWTKKEVLQMAAKTLKRQYKGYVLGGVDMANRSKSLQITFRYNENEVYSVVCKHKGKDANDWMGNIYKTQVDDELLVSYHALKWDKKTRDLMTQTRMKDSEVDLFVNDKEKLKVVTPTRNL